MKRCGMAASEPNHHHDDHDRRSIINVAVRWRRKEKCNIYCKGLPSKLSVNQSFFVRSCQLHKFSIFFFGSWAIDAPHNTSLRLIVDQRPKENYLLLRKMQFFCNFWLINWYPKLIAFQIIYELFMGLVREIITLLSWWWWWLLCCNLYHLQRTWTNWLYVRLSPFIS